MFKHSKTVIHKRSISTRKYFDNIASELGISTHGDWKRLTESKIIKKGGADILNEHKTLSCALKSVYPEFEWNPWEIGKIRRGFWHKPENQRKYFDWIGSCLGLQNKEDWYNVRMIDVMHFPGFQMVTKYHSGSMIKALQHIYPEYEWKPFLFSWVFSQYWSHMYRRKQYFDWIADQFGIEKQEQWYSISSADLEKKHGRGALNFYYKGSLARALEDVYPECTWYPWLFEVCPRGYWLNWDNVLKAMEWLKEKLGIRELDDWYDVPVSHLNRFFGYNMFQVHGGFVNTLIKCYPHHNWNKRRFLMTLRKSQQLLMKLVLNHFKQVKDFQVNYKHPQLKYSSGRGMELDIFLPSLSIAFEYQGMQHFQPTSLIGSEESTQKNDAEKRSKCKELGITLIEVPYWWDHDIHSLLATIHKYRPDLVDASEVKADPIPDVPPTSVQGELHGNVIADATETLKWLNKLAEKLNVLKLDDWYTVTKQQLSEAGAQTFLDNNYQGSLAAALQHVYPNTEWMFWRFNSRGVLPKDYWNNPKHQRNFFEFISSQLGVKSMDEWYAVNSKDVQHKDFQHIMKLYNESLVQALNSIFPEFPWQPHKFSQLPRGFFLEIQNQRKVFDDVTNQLQLKDMNAWYDIKLQQIKDENALLIINQYYYQNLSRALMKIYSEHKWLPWRFEEPPRNFWNQPSNQKMFVDWLANELNILDLLEWYNVSTATVIEKGGGGLLKRHGGSLVKAVSMCYPELPLWTAERVPRDYWSSITHLKSYIEWLGKKLGVVELDDWYSVPIESVKMMKGSQILYREGGLIQVLMKVYPEHPWNEANHQSKMKKVENYLLKMTKRIFPDNQVETCYVPTNMAYPSTAAKMELDIYIPSLSLAIEYQGEQHFNDLKFWGKLEPTQNRDNNKAEMCKSLGITLISVPYWWDKMEDSLMATIHKHRPELFPNVTAAPISDEPVYPFASDDADPVLMDEISSWTQ